GAADPAGGGGAAHIAGRGGRGAGGVRRADRAAARAAADAHRGPQPASGGVHGRGAAGGGRLGGAARLPRAPASGGRGDGVPRRRVPDLAPCDRTQDGTNLMTDGNARLTGAGLALGYDGRIVAED